MLPRSHRLTSQDFKNFPSDASTYHTPYFVARVAHSDFSSPPRFGVVISYKVAKRAVDRHRLKRRVHGMIEQYVNHLKKGYAVVLYMKKAAWNAASDDMEKEFVDICRRADLFAADTAS